MLEIVTNGRAAFDHVHVWYSETKIHNAIVKKYKVVLHVGRNIRLIYLMYYPICINIDHQFMADIYLG